MGPRGRRSRSSGFFLERLSQAPAAAGRGRPCPACPQPWASPGLPWGAAARAAPPGDEDAPSRPAPRPADGAPGCSAGVSPAPHGGSLGARRKKSLTGEEKRRVQGGPVGLCLQDPARPGTCTVPKSEFWSSYRLNVTEVNPLGASFRLLDVTMQAILKPDPPEGLVVEPVPQAPRRLRVHWQYPTSWPKEPHFQLKFRLQYRPVMHRAWSVVETANLSEVITDAFSGLEHVVQVGAKDFLDAGNWSEWSAEARATPVTVPPDPAATARTETTTETGPERLAHEPSPAPNPEPIDRSDPTERIAVLASLGVFACVVLAAVLFVALLVWRRARCQGKETPEKHDFLAAAVHLKALPKAQIL
uniref:Interleukin 11 receptor subunit alpha n=1 Tax=Crocodylus porosus TaxID=8502 RepID=A0A7M4G138_CROPO